MTEKLEDRRLLSAEVLTTAWGFVPQLEDGVVVNGRHVFVATTDDLGREVWATDGTPAGTGPLADFQPGPDDGVPYPSAGFTPFNGEQVFSAVIDGMPALAHTDGRPENTAELVRLPSVAADLVTLRGPDGVERVIAATRAGIFATDATSLVDLTPARKQRSLALRGTFQTSVLAENGTHALIRFASTDIDRQDVVLTDGTIAGTHVIARGIASTTPIKLAQPEQLQAHPLTDGLLLFSHHSGKHGWELIGVDTDEVYTTRLYTGGRDRPTTLRLFNDRPVLEFESRVVLLSNGWRELDQQGLFDVVGSRTVAGVDQLVGLQELDDLDGGSDFGQTDLVVRLTTVEGDAFATTTVTQSDDLKVEQYDKSPGFGAVNGTAVSVGDDLYFTTRVEQEVYALTVSVPPSTPTQTLRVLWRLDDSGRTRSWRLRTQIGN